MQYEPCMAARRRLRATSSPEAVVADEVKSLANQTAKATTDVRAQTATIQLATGAALTAIPGISQTVQGMEEIAASMGPRSAAMQEVSVNVQQVARRTQQVARDLTSVSDGLATNGGRRGVELGPPIGITSTGASSGGRRLPRRLRHVVRSIPSATLKAPGSGTMRHAAPRAFREAAGRGDTRRDQPAEQMSATTGLNIALSSSCSSPWRPTSCLADNHLGFKISHCVSRYGEHHRCRSRKAASPWYSADGYIL
jgi:hypothetical protein